MDHHNDTYNGILVEESLQVRHEDRSCTISVDLLKAQRRCKIIALIQLLLNVIQVQSQYDLLVNQASQRVLTLCVQHNQILRLLQGHLLTKCLIGQW